MTLYHCTYGEHETERLTKMVDGTWHGKPIKLGFCHDHFLSEMLWRKEQNEKFCNDPSFSKFSIPEWDGLEISTPLLSLE